jgi:PAS domain S-box-containing protein
MRPNETKDRIAALEAEIASLRGQLAAANAALSPLPTSGIHLDKAAKCIIESGRQLVQADFGAFFYYAVDDSGEQHMQYAVGGEAQESFANFPIPGHTALFGPVFEGVSVVRSDDVIKDARYGHSAPYFGMPPEHIPVRSYLAAPVRATDGEVLGALVFGHRQPSAFSERSERTAVGIAELAALALQNSKLLRAVINSERRCKALIENSTDGILVIDASSIIRYASPSVTAIEGREPDEIIGTDVTDLIHPEDVAAVREFLQLVLDNPGQHVTHAARRQHKDGHWLRLEGTTTNLLHDPAVRGIVANYRDVTERRRNQEALMRSQKMEALGTLAGGIAHDFNNLLLAITGNATLAKADLPEDHPVQRSLSEITKASRRATDLVGRILAFSRQQEPKREILALPAVIQDAQQLLRATLPAMIGIEAKFCADTPKVYVDSSQIHQVMMNLVTNAAHAIGTKPGAIKICAESVEIDENFGRSLGLTPGCYAHITVSDTGCGMSKSTIARIFDPFFTTKPPGQGTGLGLSVVHGIVNAHRGAINVYSEPTKGSVFHIYLPAAVGYDSPAVVARPIAAQGTGQRVLYIDDDAAIVYLTARILERSGYKVTGCDSPLEGLEAFRGSPDNFDVVVTDLSMPQMSGFDVARELQSIRPDIPILMTSGYVRAEDRDEARAVGVRDVILKPDTVDELGLALAGLFQQMDLGGEHHRGA